LDRHIITFTRNTLHHRQTDDGRTMSEQYNRLKIGKTRRTLRKEVKIKSNEPGCY